MSRQCKCYKEKSNIAPDLFIGGTPVNCGNCGIWGGVRCSDEKAVVDENKFGEHIGFVQW